MLFIQTNNGVIMPNEIAGKNVASRIYDDCVYDRHDCGSKLVISGHEFHTGRLRGYKSEIINLIRRLPTDRNAPYSPECKPRCKNRPRYNPYTDNNKVVKMLLLEEAIKNLNQRSYT